MIFHKIRHHCPNAPLILVGTKIDLRDDSSSREELESQGKELIMTSEGEEMAKDIGALHYLECSALTRSGLLTPFSFFLFLVLSGSYLIVFHVLTTFFFFFEYFYRPQKCF